jgi:hypothetical protein
MKIKAGLTNGIIFLLPTICFYIESNYPNTNSYCISFAFLAWQITLSKGAKNG